MSCEHKQFKTVAEVAGTDVQGFFAVKLLVTCAGCGSPLKFSEESKMRTQNRGLVGVVMGEMAGD